MTNAAKYYKHLDNLKAEHQSLDLKIQRITRSRIVNQFELQTLKKQRLSLKELIFKEQFKINPPNNDNSTSADKN